MVAIIRTWVIVCLALIWAPLVAHCQVEAVSGAQLLTCHSDKMASETPDSHCCDCLSCSCDSAHYHQLQNQIRICIIQSVIETAPLMESGNGLSSEVSLGILTAAPPESLHCWQFSSRAALPVRAPSFAS